MSQHPAGLLAHEQLAVAALLVADMSWQALIAVNFLLDQFASAIPCWRCSDIAFSRHERVQLPAKEDLTAMSLISQAADYEGLCKRA